MALSLSILESLVEFVTSKLSRDSFCLPSSLFTQFSTSSTEKKTLYATFLRYLCNLIQANSRLERADFRPGRADFRPERALEGATDGRTDGQTDK